MFSNNPLGNKAVQAHGITTKFIPFIFMLITFFYILEYTSETLSFIEPEDMYMGLTIIIGGGFIFLYEGFESHSKNNHSSAFAILFALSAISFIYGIAILFDLYDPFTFQGRTDLIDYILLSTVFASLLILGVGAIYEIHLSRRLRLEKWLPS